MGRVCSLSCKKQNPLRAQGQDGTFDTLYRTFTTPTLSSAQFGLSSLNSVAMSLFSSLHTAGCRRSVRSRRRGKSSSWTACRHGTTPHSPPFCTDRLWRAKSKFLWGVTERIMGNSRLIWKKPLSAPCLPAARQTLRCGKTRAGEKCIRIGMRAAGSAIMTQTVLRTPAHPNNHPLLASVDRTSSARLGHSHANRV